MGAANCSCKGVSKECFVVLTADDPPAPAASSPSDPKSCKEPKDQVVLPALPASARALEKQSDGPPLLTASNPEKSSAPVPKLPLSAGTDSDASTTASATQSLQKETGEALKAASREKSPDTPVVIGRGDAKVRIDSKPVAEAQTKEAAPEQTSEAVEDRKPASPASGDQTLQSLDPGMAKKAASYKKRQESKGKKGSIASRIAASDEGYLSELFEVEADVPYRFMVEVCGNINDQVVSAACASSAASELCEAAPPMDEKNEDSPSNGGKTLLRRNSSSQILPYVCLSVVSEHQPEASKKQRFAKLSFRPLMPGKLTKSCQSASAAESAAIVFPVTIDPSGPEEDTLAEQLQAVDEVVLHMKDVVPATRRPVPAVILCRSRPKSSTKDGAEAWQEDVQQFEESSGRMLRFGPIDLEDGDGLHGAFTSIVALRIHAKEKGFTNKQIWNTGIDPVPPWPLVDFALPASASQQS
eukprot:gb/GFBE01049778.1/.p1 GENE.gb/GFBE01049778.1/~~gb/GFBE01049778.1/.p1  ORF type:complete len:471 (+),score=95.72 gb/GFBE01049778.1/:1-1413(+)